MLAALGSIATQQANPTENTMKKVKQLLYYATTHPDVVVTYQARGMILEVHINASHISEKNSKSRAGGQFSYPMNPLRHQRMEPSSI